MYYRGFDLNVPDSYHYEEWKREFDQYVVNGNLPALEIMSLPLDHFGSFASNVGGLNTPSLEIADNDFVLGRLVAAVSNSPYWKDTAIFVVVELVDDCVPLSIGRNHECWRAVSIDVMGPVLGVILYNTINVLRTIEDLLGLNHLGMNDANSDPMSEAFVTSPDLTPYSPVLPGSLCQPPVDPSLIPECHQASMDRTPALPSLHDGAWWASRTQGFNFRIPDALDAAQFNRLLWRGIMGDRRSYPKQRQSSDNDD